MAKDTDESLTRVAGLNWESYVRARDAGHLTYLEDAAKARRYYQGDQWDEDDLRKLEASGRPALTINQVLPTVNAVLGEQAANRLILKFKPAKNATFEDAKMLGKLAQFIIEDQEYMWKESEVFADGLIEDRGYFDIRMDFDRNVFGDISISVEDNADILLDPDAKEYNPDTWNEVIKTRWLSVDEIEVEYGEEAANAVTGFVAATDNFDHDAFNFTSTFGQGENTRFTVTGDRERELRSVRVIERQHKRVSDVKYFVSQHGDLERVPEYMDDETVALFAVQHGYEVIERRGLRIRWTVSAGENILIHDDWSPYPWFTIIPYFPYFRRGKPFGIVKNIISPQDQLNKLSSQELHIVNSTANSGWIIEENSLGDGLTLEDIEQKGSMTGFVISYKQGRKTPEKIQSNQVPTGVDRLSIKAQGFIRDISGVSAGMQGNASPYTSGRALQDQIQRSQIQIQKPLDNLAHTRRILGRRILDLIQMYYVEERVFHIGSDLDPEMTEEEVVINQQTAEGIINDVTMGKYKVVVAQQPAVNNYREDQLQRLIEMRQAGIMVPDHYITKYSDLEDKDELAEIQKRMAGLHEPSPEEQEMAEFQRQAQIQSIQLDLQQKQAKIQELMANAGLKEAQMDSEVNPESIKNVIEILKLQQEMQISLDNLNARLRMSEMSHRASLAKTGLQQSVSIRGQDMAQETAILQSQLSTPPTQNSNEGE